MLTDQEAASGPSHIHDGVVPESSSTEPTEEDQEGDTQMETEWARLWDTSKARVRLLKAWQVLRGVSARLSVVLEAADGVETGYVIPCHGVGREQNEQVSEHVREEHLLQKNGWVNDISWMCDHDVLTRETLMR